VVLAVELYDRRMLHYYQDMRKKWLGYGTVVAVLLLVVVALLKQQDLLDWWRLRDYVAPTTVAALADDDTMTSYAERLFYVNSPAVTRASDFTRNCPTGGEKTVVLGCYVGNDHGIYVYDVTDERLNGVEQVTAAHEMLHAAYRRLSAHERTRIDALLTSYYEHDLTDQRIKDTIEAYKKSEPNDVVNEMHSVFGSEVAQLPAELEAYYQRYFTNRATVTGYTAKYQAEFTSRQTQVTQYDAQLKDLKRQIDVNNADLRRQRDSLDAQSRQLEAARSSGKYAEYNAGVASYNAAVDQYNRLLNATRALINQYNDIVEEQQLTDALSPSSLPSSP
jgi:hypothetical protein